MAWRRGLAVLVASAAGGRDGLAVGGGGAVGQGGDASAVPVPEGIAGGGAVQIAPLEEGAVVSGVVVVGVQTDGAAELRFLVDGAPRHVTDGPAWSWTWDTSTGSDGPSVLTVLAVDATGAVVASLQVRVVVANGQVGSCPLPEAHIISPPDGAVLCGTVGGAVRTEDLMAAIEGFDGDGIGELPKSTLKLFIGSMSADVNTDGDGEDDPFSVVLRLSASPVVIPP